MDIRKICRLADAAYYMENNFYYTHGTSEGVLRVQAFTGAFLTALLERLLELPDEIGESWRTVRDVFLYIQQDIAGETDDYDEDAFIDVMELLDTLDAAITAVLDDLFPVLMFDVPGAYEVGGSEGVKECIQVGLQGFFSEEEARRLSLILGEMSDVFLYPSVLILRMPEWYTWLIKHRDLLDETGKEQLLFVEECCNCDNEHSLFFYTSTTESFKDEDGETYLCICYGTTECEDVSLTYISYAFLFRCIALRCMAEELGCYGEEAAAV